MLHNSIEHSDPAGTAETLLTGIRRVHPGALQRRQQRLIGGNRDLGPRRRHRHAECLTIEHRWGGEPLEMQFDIIAADQPLPDRRQHRGRAAGVHRGAGGTFTEQFIRERPNDRIGLVAFAGRPYLMSPLTLDHDWLIKNLERLRTGLVEDGTAIGSGIASAANRLKDKEAKTKLILLLTDGDNNAGKVQPLTAAEAAKALGIRIYTIGAGTEGEAPFPLTNQFGRTVYRNVLVKFDEKTLTDIATMTGGRYFRATDTNSLRTIFGEIDKLEKTKVEVEKTAQYRDIFMWFLIPGLACLALEILLSQTVWRRLP